MRRRLLTPVVESTGPVDSRVHPLPAIDNCLVTGSNATVDVGLGGNCI